MYREQRVGATGVDLPEVGARVTAPKYIAIVWRECPQCSQHWPYANARPDGTAKAKRCPRCRKKKRQNNPAKVLSDAELARRTAKIREGWDEREFRKRCVLPDCDGVEVRVVRILIDE